MTAAAGPRAGASPKGLALAGAAAVLLAAMAWDTHFVRIGSEEDLREQGFSAEAFGAEQFPRIRAEVESRAVDAVALAEAIAEDREAAAEAHGVPGGIGPIFPVSLTGTVAEGKSGIFDVVAAGMPEDVRVRVQTGPAINGTELRDFPGDIVFGDFTNQIEYQDAGAAINDALKEEVLAGLDRDALTGREMTVTGAFRMVNPKMWLLTPVSLAVE